MLRGQSPVKSICRDDLEVKFFGMMLGRQLEAIMHVQEQCQLLFEELQYEYKMLKDSGEQQGRWYISLRHCQLAEIDIKLLNSSTTGALVCAVCMLKSIPEVYTMTRYIS